MVTLHKLSKRRPYDPCIRHIYFSFNKWNICICMESPKKNKAIHLYYATKFKYASQTKGQTQIFSRVDRRFNEGKWLKFQDLGPFHHTT